VAQQPVLGSAPNGTFATFPPPPAWASGLFTWPAAPPAAGDQPDASTHCAAPPSLAELQAQLAAAQTALKAAAQPLRPEDMVAAPPPPSNRAEDNGGVGAFSCPGVLAVPRCVH
jgi:hypothetical protein